MKSNETRSSFKIIFEFLIDVHYLPYDRSMMDAFYLEFHLQGSDNST